jgi:hypothetical protein
MIQAPVPVGWGFSFSDPDLALATRTLGLFYACRLFLSCLSQQKVFKHEPAVATGKRRTANTAGHFFKDALRSGFDFDNVITALGSSDT